LQRVLKRRAIVFVLSDFVSPDFSKPLALAARKFDLVALNIRDDREKSLVGSGLIRLWDQERGVERLIDLNSRDARERFAASAARRDDELSGLFNRYGVDRVDIDTQKDYIVPLSLFFRSRAKRK
jgi:hypothetical protein